MRGQPPGRDQNKNTNTWREERAGHTWQSVLAVLGADTGQDLSLEGHPRSYTPQSPKGLSTELATAKRVLDQWVPTLSLNGSSRTRLE